MKKELYRELEMEIIYFDCEDVLTSSGNGSGQTSGGNGGDNGYEWGGEVEDP